MDVIIMPKVNSLITQLSADYPEISFQPSDGFRWSPDEHTIYIDQKMPHADAFCLHELSHAILGHHEYNRDIELIKLERDAWNYAKQNLSLAYHVNISETVAEDNLDTYRNWLHARSTCPNCDATGLQFGRKQYKCLGCGHKWDVNEARVCALRRHSHQKNAS